MVLRGYRQLRLMTTLEAMDVFGLDHGVPFPRGKAGSENRPALAGPNQEGLQKRYKEMVMVSHPDRGGSHDEMARINQAHQILKRELPSRPQHQDASYSNTAKEEETMRENARQYSKPEEPPHVKARRERMQREAEEAAHQREQERHKAWKRASEPEEVPSQRESNSKCLFSKFFNRKQYMADSHMTEKQYQHLEKLEKNKLELLRRESLKPRSYSVAEAQLRKENNGSIRKKSNVKASPGVWI